MELLHQPQCRKEEAFKEICWVGMVWLWPDAFGISVIPDSGAIRGLRGGGGVVQPHCCSGSTVRLFYRGGFLTARLCLLSLRLSGALVPTGCCCCFLVGLLHVALVGVRRQAAALIKEALWRGAAGDAAEALNSAGAPGGGFLGGGREHQRPCFRAPQASRYRLRRFTAARRSARGKRKFKWKTPL